MVKLKVNRIGADGAISQIEIEADHGKTLRELVRLMGLSESGAIILNGQIFPGEEMAQPGDVITEPKGF